MTSGVDDTGNITDNPDTETAVLAGGCFWGMEDLFRHQPGVVNTRVGYTGGENDHATYGNHPGHAEAIEIEFDPTVTTYREVLAYFFQVHDPTTLNSQGNDYGSSYRSAIFPISMRVRSRSRETQSQTLTHQDSGQARPSPPSNLPTHSGKPSPSIRTIWSPTPMATPATSNAPNGCYPGALEENPQA